jgi:Transposase DDE domain
VPLSGLSGHWATFSAGVCGAKAHIIYDPDADQPLYLMVTAANVNDITAAKEMPIEPGATYVFDLGYYDYGWWARLHQADCRIVTRLKANTPFATVEDRPIPPGSSIRSDRTGHLPKRLAASRNNPMSGLVREVRVEMETGKELRIFTNDLTVSAQEIAELYKRRWAIGVSSEGHAVMSVKVRPKLKDSGFEAREAPWRESKTAEPSDNMLKRSVREASGCNVQ